MQITLGQQYNVGEKPTVIMYIYINRHAGTPPTPKRFDKTISQHPPLPDWVDALLKVRSDLSLNTGSDVTVPQQ